MGTVLYQAIQFIVALLFHYKGTKTQIRFALLGHRKKGRFALLSFTALGSPYVINIFLNCSHFI
jgi:hypothetical protein